LKRGCLIVLWLLVSPCIVIAGALWLGLIQTVTLAFYLEWFVMCDVASLTLLGINAMGRR